MDNEPVNFQDVSFEEKGYAGIITLKRENALNALSLPMILAMRRQLHFWNKAPSVHFVLVKSTSKRAFCAGGDLKSVYDARKRKDWEFLEELFRQEYSLNYDIKNFSKPYISLIDGIVMGGGLGISIHGSHRVMTQNTVFAMPETSIGYFPDVGATHFLNQMPGKLGLYVGLTGNHFLSCDTFHLGVGTHYVSAHKLKRLETELLNLKNPSKSQINQILSRYHTLPEEAPICKHEAEINTLLEATSLQDILGHLARAATPFANTFYHTLQMRSPTSLFVTFEQLKRGKELNHFKDVMNLEFKISQNFVHSHDFIEGIRAAVIDKDRTPCFEPRSLHDVHLDSLGEWFVSQKAPLDFEPI